MSFESLSRTQNRNPTRSPNAIMKLRACWITMSTVKKSHASVVAACARQNSRQDGPVRHGAGSRPALRRIFQTVAGATRWPSPISSP